MFKWTDGDDMDFHQDYPISCVEHQGQLLTDCNGWDNMALVGQSFRKPQLQQLVIGVAPTQLRSAVRTSCGAGATYIRGQTATGSYT